MQLRAPSQLRRNSNPGLFIASIVLSFLLLAMLIWPKFATLRANRSTLANAKADNQKLVQAKAKVNQAINDLRTNSSDVERLNQAIPDHNSPSELYALIETLALSANLKLGSLQVVDSTKGATATAPVATGGTGPANTPPGGTGPATPTGSGPANAGSQVLPSVIGTTELNIEVVGTIEGFNQFLASLENSLRVIDVQSIDVSAVKERQGQLSFRVGLKTYYQK